MNKKMIIFDIDGTLVDNVNHKIHSSTISCLNKLALNGNVLVIASGRHFANINNIDEIKHLFNNYILINGTQIISNESIIYKNVYDKKELKPLLEGLEKENIAYACVSKNDVYANKTNEIVKYAYSLFGLYEVKVDDEYYLKEEIYQVWCFGQNEEIKEFSKKYPNLKFLSWGIYGFDVLKHDVSKGCAIKILAKHLGIDMKDTIAIGDGLNDIEMIKECNIGIAMGNANEKLKECADYVTDDVSKDGLYKAFKHLNLI